MLLSSVSALQASSLRMDISAHNVANVNTPGFAKSRPVQTSLNPGTEISAIQKTEAPTPDLSATDLAEEVAQQIISEKDFAANAAVIKTQDKMLGELVNLVV
ncbi:MAG: flagellar basal body protein [Candidatus Fibromonas sp.]|jgi:flagellar basal-body rod protein FlgC|nr:flagellar basal body protein [Candidatus Fibromonas sp.]